jgi:hypothetical protein
MSTSRNSSLPHPCGGKRALEKIGRVPVRKPVKKFTVKDSACKTPALAQPHPQIPSQTSFYEHN